MKANKDSTIIGAIILIFIWLAIISLTIVDLYSYKTYIIDNLGEIYYMIADVYQQLTNIFTMGVL